MLHTCEISVKLGSCYYTIPFVIPFAIIKQAIICQQFHVQFPQVAINFVDGTLYISHFSSYIDQIPMIHQVPKFRA
jgi:hypothetical protein